MKIGLISGEFPPMPGGVGDFTRLLAENIQQQGHDVFVLSRVGSASANLPVSTVAGWGAGCLRQARRWARHCDLDLVNLQYQTAAFDMSPFIHFLPDTVGLPLVATFHDLRSPYLFPKAGPLRDWIVMRLARAARGVITTNREDDEGLRSLPKRRMIPIGSSIKRLTLSASERSAYRRRLGADHDGCILLGHFGFVRAIKGVDYLVDALDQLRRTGMDLRMVFIGERSNAVDDRAEACFLQEFEARIRQRDLQNVVHWTGFLPADDVSACLNAVDFTVLPYVDGASLRRSSLIAALHQGCAIITTEPLLEEPAFAHGRNLWLAQRRSSEAIADAVSHLTAAPEQAAALRAGAKRLSDEFDWDRITRSTLDFFQACL